MGNGRDPTTNPYYNIHGLAGQEISSSLEGRHILVQEEELLHLEHDSGLDLVRKGDPVLLYGLGGVGVALKTAASLDEAVPIDTEGIWRLSVTSYYGVYVGQPLFIDIDGIITDDPFWAYATYGYALQEIVFGGDGSQTEVIAVKVHWGVPWWWFLNGL